MQNSSVLEALANVRAVPVIRASTADDAVAMGTSLASGGLTVLEATFTTPDAASVIRRLAEIDGVIVGAGTVLTPEQARIAVAAGASFLVSPVWLPWLPDLAAELGVAAIPGAASPTEIWQAHAAGSAAVKVFPIARLGGPAFIKDLLAPMPQLKLIATGGVNIAMAKELLGAGCIAVGLGSVHTDPSLGHSVTERAQEVIISLSS